ncbi:MAG: SulP family inorganic anion transporter [Bacteroidetes bacterium]|nr:SulP family inorganic anion transporter [Bacteroidota bacterium]
MKNKLFSSVQADSKSGLVVFLVALPLCLGIAIASGAPPLAGIITGIIGGIVVGLLSNSNVSVSGPAAGLIAIVLLAINDLGFEAFILSVMLAGIFQIILGFAKAGNISNYFPSGVIYGMLTGIGIIIIKKELPHAIGYDKEHEGDFFDYNLYKEDSGFFNELINALNYSHLGIIITTLICLSILIAFNQIASLKKIKAVPGALVVVVVGIALNEIYRMAVPDFLIKDEHLVSLPVASSFNEFIGQFSTPDFSAITNLNVWVTAVTIAAVASIETLLCIEAGDKMDPYKRYTSANKELKAQGIGNILTGLLGGLPLTSVIVRTTANITSGAKTKLSAVIHGVLLFIAVILIPSLLNKIPMAALAAILLMIGYKLASPLVFKQMYSIGKFQFIPFIVTVIGVVGTDLLKGVGMGLITSILFILTGNLKIAYFFRKEKHAEGEVVKINLAQEVSFLNKAAIKQTLAHLPENSRVIISAHDTVYIDYDVLELIRDFSEHGCKNKNIFVELHDFKKAYKVSNSIENSRVS